MHIYDPADLTIEWLDTKLNTGWSSCSGEDESFIDIYADKKTIKLSFFLSSNSADFMLKNLGKRGEMIIKYKDHLLISGWYILIKDRLGSGLKIGNTAPDITFLLRKS